MALVTSSCSQLVWHFWHCESSPFCASFPLALLPAIAILKWDLSFLFDLGLKLRSDGVSGPSCCDVVSDTSSLFVEVRESCDLDLVSPFMMIVFKWVVKLFSGSSGLSWEPLSCEPFDSTAGGSGSWSPFASTDSWGELYWEMTIDGRGEVTLPFWAELQWFSKDSAVDSVFRVDDTVFSFGTSVCRLELCKEDKQSGCESPPLRFRL